MLSSVEKLDDVGVKKMKKNFDSLSGEQQKFITTRIPKVRQEIEYMDKIINYITQPYKKSLETGTTGKTLGPLINKGLQKMWGPSAIGVSLISGSPILGASLALTHGVLTRPAIQKLLTKNTLAEQKKAMAMILKEIEHKATLDAPRLFAGNPEQQRAFTKSSRVLGKIITLGGGPEIRDNLKAMMGRQIVTGLYLDSQKAVDKKKK